MTNEFKMRPKAEIGDLVTVDGYGNRVWKVDAYDLNKRFESGIVAEEITYEVVCVDTGEYDIAWHEDVTLLVKADGAAAYLRNRPIGQKHVKIDKIFVFSADKPAEEDAEKPEGTTAKARKKDSLTNRLLDERNDIAGLSAMLGDHDGEYAKRIAEIDAKLKRIAGGE